MGNWVYALYHLIPFWPTLGSHRGQVTSVRWRIKSETREIADLWKTAEKRGNQLLTSNIQSFTIIATRNTSPT